MKKKVFLILLISVAGFFTWFALNNKEKQKQVEVSYPENTKIYWQIQSMARLDEIMQLKNLPKLSQKISATSKHISFFNIIESQDWETWGLAYEGKVGLGFLEEENYSCLILTTRVVDQRKLQQQISDRFSDRFFFKTLDAHNYFVDQVKKPNWLITNQEQLLQVYLFFRSPEKIPSSFFHPLVTRKIETYRSDWDGTLIYPKTLSNSQETTAGYNFVFWKMIDQVNDQAVEAQFWPTDQGSIIIRQGIKSWMENIAVTSAQHPIIPKKFSWFLRRVQTKFLAFTPEKAPFISKSTIENNLSYISFSLPSTWGTNFGKDVEDIWYLMEREYHAFLAIQRKPEVSLQEQWEKWQLIQKFQKSYPIGEYSQRLDLVVQKLEKSFQNFLQEYFEKLNKLAEHQGSLPKAWKLKEEFPKYLSNWIMQNNTTCQENLNKVAAKILREAIVALEEEQESLVRAKERLLPPENMISQYWQHDSSSLTIFKQQEKILSLLQENERLHQEISDEFLTYEKSLRYIQEEYRIFYKKYFTAMQQQNYIEAKDLLNSFYEIFTQLQIHPVPEDIYQAIQIMRAEQKNIRAHFLKVEKNLSRYLGSYTVLEDIHGLKVRGNITMLHKGTIWIKGKQGEKKIFTTTLVHKSLRRFLYNVEEKDIEGFLAILIFYSGKYEEALEKWKSLGKEEVVVFYQKMMENHLLVGESLKENQ